MRTGVAGKSRPAKPSSHSIRNSAFGDLGVNRPDIVAENADEEHLNRGEEAQADDQRGLAHGEIFPEDQLGDQVGKADREGAERQEEAKHRRQPLRHLGMVGEPELRDGILRRISGDRSAELVAKRHKGYTVI